MFSFYYRSLSLTKTFETTNFNQKAPYERLLIVHTVLFLSFSIDSCLILPACNRCKLPGMLSLSLFRLFRFPASYSSFLHMCPQVYYGYILLPSLTPYPMSLPPIHVLERFSCNSSPYGCLSECLPSNVGSIILQMRSNIHL